MFYDVQLLGRKSSLYVAWQAGISGARKLHKSRIMAQSIRELWFGANIIALFLHALQRVPGGAGGPHLAAHHGRAAQGPLRDPRAADALSARYSHLSPCAPPYTCTPVDVKALDARCFTSAPLIRAELSSLQARSATHSRDNQPLILSQRVDAITMQEPAPHLIDGHEEFAALLVPNATVAAAGLHVAQANVEFAANHAEAFPELIDMPEVAAAAAGPMLRTQQTPLPKRVTAAASHQACAAPCLHKP